MFRQQNQRLGEQERQVAGLFRIGRIFAANYGQAKVRVKDGSGWESNWLPFMSLRAGKNKLWFPPEVGEQVLVLCPSGDPAQGVVLPGLYSEANPQTGQSGQEFKLDFEDGSYLRHDSSTGKMALHSAGDLALSATGKISLDAAHIALQEGS